MCSVLILKIMILKESILFDLLNLEMEVNVEIKSCLGIKFEFKSKYLIALTIIHQAQDV